MTNHKVPGSRRKRFASRESDWPKTLYPEIFGVPESWMLTVSLILRLGKQRDVSELADSNSTLSLTEFLSRAKSIENYISQLQPPSPIATTNQHPQGDPNILNNMLDATHQALAIYFYRRIYDLDASMLQYRVANVRDCLSRDDHSDNGQSHSSVRLIWPAFIAAREARDVGCESFICELVQQSGAAKWITSVQ